ncbi:HAL/PAL/TAL family ammonia-lyase [Burkholderia oklahomensis]|uniref:Aromatic amino acid lyase family protein n=1 Tax=Burkholderia oklahomensis TaxID=342113 RepID=A0AAI8BCP3_9BURK|nr:histidine ammonia-lyase [Burkholderia oklahomensis]AIO69700.1 aromatic amino acid lyase family protein [Burkholderia oklahomensis]AJX35313.1 aromatic amino acid lyase family protein [Burkholderia oklahomensis C6786]AOI38271.1 histidine ammonia-lyase [Burkholderia oklahomensis EO147]AOI47993.1 histidine ammonia-lyase [Burkholderia oklahomensis C6786]KUY48606.1 histidine ammonia-lyase [Burkholderia oklahomensis EO147]
MIISRSERPLDWRQIAAVAAGARLELAADALARIASARELVDEIVARDIRAYGVNTGVGALCDVIVSPAEQSTLSRNILMSHAVGVGTPLGATETRAIIAAAINNYAHGHSGIRVDVVRHLVALLGADCLPEVPAHGSVGYLTHMAHVALVCIGYGHARHRGERVSGRAALQRIGLEPLALGAKEGLSLVNGTPCVTGLAALALARAERLLDWADCVAAMSFENLCGQLAAFDAASLALRVSPGIGRVGARMRAALGDSGILAAAAGRRTQDPLSLRTIPHVHGAARDVFAATADVVDRELASVTDNPIVAGTRDAPLVYSQAHAVGAGIALAMDSLAAAMAQVAAIAERRLDRLVNPLVSGLPGFLAAPGGTCSGFMIAQYTAVALVAQNQRLAAPASLDGGITSGLQEDHLCHATPAALKALDIIENATRVLAIEWLAAAQAYDLQPDDLRRAAHTDALLQRVRERIALYRDDRPLADDISAAAQIIASSMPPVL